MAYIGKHGKRWRAQVRIKGLKASKSFDTKLEAQAWAVQQEVQAGAHGGIVHGRTLGEAMQRYAEEVSPHHAGSRWEQVRLEKISRDVIANITLQNLSADDLQHWVNRQEAAGLKSSSIIRELTLLGCVLKEARLRWKWMHHTPMADVRRPKPPRHRERRISETEKARLLLALEYEEEGPVETLRQKIAVAFLLALETAMRQGELWALRWGDVDLKKQVCVLHHTKNGSRREVPLTTRAVALFKKLHPATAGRVLDVNQATAGAVFHRAVQLAGIHDLTFHDTRHEAITQLARKLDVLDLARMVGHRDIRSLMIYYNAGAAEIAKRLG